MIPSVSTPFVRELNREIEISGQTSVNTDLQKNEEFNIKVHEKCSSLVLRIKEDIRVCDNNDIQNLKIYSITTINLDLSEKIQFIEITIIFFRVFSFRNNNGSGEISIITVPKINIDLFKTSKVKLSIKDKSEENNKDESNKVVCQRYKTFPKFDLRFKKSSLGA